MLFTVNRKNTEVRDQQHLMDAEGTSDVMPIAIDIQALLAEEGYNCQDIDISYDTMQHFWRWCCEISFIENFEPKFDQLKAADFDQMGFIASCHLFTARRMAIAAIYQTPTVEENDSVGVLLPFIYALSRAEIYTSYHSENSKNVHNLSRQKRYGK